MATVLLRLFVSLVVINAALALTCYKCDSSESASCNYALARFTYPTTNCSNVDGGLGSLTSWIPKQCVKIVAIGKDGSKYVARDCMPALGDDVCKGIAKTLGVLGGEGANKVESLNCYTCDSDKCNGANSNNKYGGFMFLGVVIAALAFLF